MANNPADRPVDRPAPHPVLSRQLHGGRLGAEVIEVGDHGARPTTWAELDMVDHWRRYMADPTRYLRHIVEP